jgi:hypothetical protein
LELKGIQKLGEIPFPSYGEFIATELGSVRRKERVISRNNQKSVTSPCSMSASSIVELVVEMVKDWWRGHNSLKLFANRVARHDGKANQSQAFGDG